MENLPYKWMTAKEYLKFERSSLEKHEFYNGEVFNMAGAKKDHNLIVSNLIAIFHTWFRGKPCVVYPSDMKVVIDQNNHYVYPDITLVCDQSKFLDKSEDILLNPSTIIEVLSKSTETYDRGGNSAYRKIPSLKEYVLVASEYKKIEVFTKSADGRWFLTEADPEEKIQLSSIDYYLSLNDVYDKIKFDI